MKRVLIWDLPVRFFHWLFAASFFVAFGIAWLLGDHSPVFPVHMLLGGVMAFMVLLRIVWGFTGSRWARFETFEVNPKEAIGYFVGAITGKARRFAGHNPGSSLAAYAMFVLLIGLATTGILMGNGYHGAVEELHELMAWAMVVVVGAHLLGIILHSIRHRELLPLSMIDGRKQAEPEVAIPSARPVVALVFLVLTALWTAGLINGYDSETGRLNLPVVGDVIEVEPEHH
ncbi:MAG TPA: cytochrome b/b6 domain-containing protein, partial [Rhodothermales bacterium]